MEFSTQWIAEYVDLPDGGVDDLAELLTAAGMAVEGRREVSQESGDDVVLDIDVTTNRPDCMNHLGLARETAAVTGHELRRPGGQQPALQKPPSQKPAAHQPAVTTAARLAVEDADLCPRYVALVIRGVRVGESPQWLKDRLEAIGSRSINNVVDITNYVLWETGQPLHAFDLAEIGAGDGDLPEIRVRRAKKGETLVTLDDESRELDPEILVIADAEKPIALAGIMGGDESEVGDDTVDVLLESAHFDPATVRRGASKLGMHTDASHRFERGADPGACLWAAERAARLIAELAGGEVLAGHLEEPPPNGALRDEWPPRVDIDLGRLNRFGGTELDAAAVEGILSRLGFGIDRHGSVERGDSIRWTVEAPSWRYYDFADGFTEPHAQDVYEEVLRIHGFDQIPTTLPALAAPDGRSAPAHLLRRKVQDVLAAAGLTEAIDFAFHDADRDAAYPSLYGGRPALRLANPVSDRYDTMRRSLLPNLVESARFNVRRNAQSVRLFEIGHVFVSKEGGSASDTDSSHDEMEALALVLGGHLGTPWERRLELDFYDAKGVIEAVAGELGAEIGFRAAERPMLRPGATAEIFLEEDGEEEQRVIGHLGRLDADDEPYPLYVAEIALEPLGRGGLDLETNPPSRYPGIEVDTTLTHPRSVPWREIAERIEARQVEDLVHFEMVDRYTGEGVPEGAVNTTITFLYTADDRSLTQDEVNERHQALAAHLEERFGR